jgi:CRISPR type III-A-associated RAMP protein Csm4
MIQEFQIIKLYFHEPVALMSEKKDEFQNEVSVLPSDMLKAALVSALALEKNQTEIDQFNHDLVISSAYLFAGEHYFFPKPMSILPIETTFDPKHQKLIKNIQFVEKNIFEKVISGQKQSITEKNLVENGKLWVNDNQYFTQPIYKSQTKERVSIGNTNVFEMAEKGSPYYISRTYFNQDIKAGMYFIYQTKNEELLLKALDRLQYEGIGADRRLGNGKFYFEQ